jgi:endo-1,3(4)-beta-glucanase
MDWYVGHSWAAGLFEFGDSRNQESTSEAVNAWYALKLWGEATSRDWLADLGAFMTAVEIRSAQMYWQVRADTEIYAGTEFANGRVVGILWSNKVAYETFFGRNPEYMHGIQYLPFTPAAEDLLDPTWIRDAYPVVSTALTRPSPALGEGWRGLIYLAHAIIEPETAWTEVNSLTGFDDGNSLTNSLYWVATRP